MKSQLGTVTLILAFIMTIAAYAQPDLDWLRTYGGDDNEYLHDVCQTPDDGFLIAGSVSYNYGAVLTRTNSVGDVQWTRTYGGDIMRFCGRLRTTTDHGFILAGAMMNANQRDELVLQKITAGGDPLWRFVLSDYPGAEIQWMEATSDGGCIAGGFVYESSPITRALLFKVDADGHLQWARTYGGNYYEKCWIVLPAPDGGYFLIGGRYDVEIPHEQLWVMKVSATGDSLWSRVYSFPYRPEFKSAHLTADDGLAVAGIYYEARRLDWYLGSPVLIRLSASGDSLWTRTYMTGECMTCAYLDCTRDGGFILAGDHGLLRVDGRGDSLWCMPYASDLCMQTSDAGFLLAGTMGMYDSDIFLLKTDSDPMAVEPTTASLPNAVALHPNFPNPFNAVTTIRFDLAREGTVKLAVFDMNSRLVQSLASGQYSAGSHTIRFDADDLPSGIYFCRLNVGGFATTQKMILLK
jgi:hypothetical protein